MRVAIVVAKFNDFVTERLLAGAQEAIRESGVDDVVVLRVPGAFEIPIAAQRVAASACAHGVTAAAAATGVPMTFGVLTTHSIEEALERAGPGDANKGREAALAAIDLVRTLQSLDNAGR